jgi:hypothetical protein
LAAALCALLCLTGSAFAQIPINDIQVYDNAGLPASPYDATVQTVRGVVTCPLNIYNAGTTYIQDATGGMSFFLTGSGLVLGDSVEVTGTVGAFSGEIQLATPSVSVLGFGTVPAPLDLTVNEAVDYDGSGTQSSGDYEIVGTLVTVTGTVTYVNSTATFKLYDGADSIEVYIDSTTGIDDTGVGEGDLYAITSPMTNYNGLLELKPRYQTDMVENPGNPFPVIENITPNPWSPDANQSITVSCQISDPALQSTTLFYAYGGSGSYTSAALVNTFGNTYEATIPGTTEATIEYYLEATDDVNQTTTVPGDAPTSTLVLAVGVTSIYEIQSNRNPDDSSTYTNQTVNVEGIVTMAPGELNAPGSQWIIEEPEGGPWSGLFVFESSGGNVLFRGDKVRISGLINEFSGTTQILPQRADAVTLISFSNPAPPVDAFTSTELDTTEALENVIVRSFMSTVQDTIPASDLFTVIDTVSDSLLTVDPQFAVTIAPLPGETLIATGLLDGRFGVNELSPRDDNDFQLFATDVENQLPTRKGAYLSKIHPNPFNPSTRIEFELPRRGMAELAVFNVRGEKVAVLANGVLDGGSQFRTWNGLDLNGESVSSGVYYIRLRFETESISVQKATLVK